MRTHCRSQLRSRVQYMGDGPAWQADSRRYRCNTLQRMVGGCLSFLFLMGLAARPEELVRINVSQTLIALMELNGTFTIADLFQFCVLLASCSQGGHHNRELAGFGADKFVISLCPFLSVIIEVKL